MKYIITEQQFKKLNKSNQALTNAIIKYMNHYMESGKRKVVPKVRNYGNLREDWCIDGKEMISAIYYYDNEKFTHAYLMVSKNLIDTLSQLLSVRKSYVKHVIEEWYDNTMVPKFEQIVGESGLTIDEILEKDRDTECVPEPVKPEGISDDEMIKYIAKHSLYDEQDIMDRINSFETLEDLYLHILDIQNRQKITGF